MKKAEIKVKLAILTAASMIGVIGLQNQAYAANVSVDVSTSTFKQDTDNNADFQNWLKQVWQGGEEKYKESGKIALVPGAEETDLNFSWYSVDKGSPAVMVWKKNDASTKLFSGSSEEIYTENWQGAVYRASNKVSITGYFEKNTNYQYKYTDNFAEDNTVWSEVYDYSTVNWDNYSVILTGDPQVGASGKDNDETALDSSIARDTYNWNLTMEKAMELCPNPAFLLSAGDQIDKNGTSEEKRKTRESEYAGYLYPSIFRSLPIATTIGNHDRDGVEYSWHFNNPNSSDNLGMTEAGADYYFSYGEVLYISINSNNRNQAEHRELMQKAVSSNPDAKWKIVIFHSDIYGSGEPHADTDAVQNRIILAPLMDEFNIDVVLTGHDHTYSRSYQILDGNVIDYDISSGSVTNPDGTLYITTGSGSGSKYYNLLNYTPYYIADRCNTCLPAFSVLDFTSDSFTINTYDYNGDVYAEKFTIYKTGNDVDNVITRAEEIINTSDKYTNESISSLKTALDKLKSIKTEYEQKLTDKMTAKDNMAETISNTFNTDKDVISGYGSVSNDADKDGYNASAAEPNTYNRFAYGMSALLDKTVYSQVEPGMGRAFNGLETMTEANKSKFPVVNAQELQLAAEDVVNAMDKLEALEKETEKPTDNAADNPIENETKSSNVPEQNTEKAADAVAEQAKAPNTGDDTSCAGLIAVMAGSTVICVLICRRRAGNCQE